MKHKVKSTKDYHIVAQERVAVISIPMQVQVIPGPLSTIDVPGIKCAHGVYIPATSMEQTSSEYCSVCHPYILREIPDGLQTSSEPNTNPGFIQAETED
jgi:hypothetical protein